ncbi:MAG: PEP-CTERM sorting domain-containing protein [Tepidisphaeraceae bacterium]
MAVSQEIVLSNYEAVPEPVSMVMLALGAGLLGMRRRHRRSANSLAL